jgi:hypothetical protein
MAAIDDATGKLLAARFFPFEGVGGIEKGTKSGIGGTFINRERI